MCSVRKSGNEVPSAVHSSLNHLLSLDTKGFSDLYKNFGLQRKHFRQLDNLMNKASVSLNPFTLEVPLEVSSASLILLRITWQ